MYYYNIVMFFFNFYLFISFFFFLSIFSYLPRGIENTHGRPEEDFDGDLPAVDKSRICCVRRRRARVRNTVDVRVTEIADRQNPHRPLKHAQVE